MSKATNGHSGPRSTAARRFVETQGDVAALTAGELQALTAELQARLIELGMQSDEPRRSQDEPAPSESRLRELFDFLLEGISAADENRIVEFCNPAAVRILEEESASRMVGKTAGEYLLKAQRIPLERQLDLATESRTSSYFELDVVTAKNNVKSLLVSSSPRWNREGRYVGTYSCFIDVTERKRIADSLRESEERLRSTLASLSDILFVLDERGRCLDYYHPTDYDEPYLRPADFLGKAYAEVLPPHVTSLLDDALERAIVEDTSQRFNFQMEIPGQSRWFAATVSLRRNRPGLPSGATVLVRDVTKSQESAERLQDSERKFRAVFENANDAILIVDAGTGLILDANEEAGRLLGMPREAILGLHQTEIHPRERASEYRKIFQDLVAAGGGVWPNLAMLRTDGGQRSADISTKVASVAGKEIIFSIFRDTTERVQADERLRRHREELAHASRVSSLGEMATSIAHQLNQPLSAILSYAEAARRTFEVAGAAPAAVLSDLMQIAAEASRGGEIIHRLKSFARKRHGHSSTLDMNELIREAASLIESEARARGVWLRLDLAPELPPVLGDSIMIQQVCLNLALNALEAMASQDAGEKELTIGTSTDASGSVEVSVIDSGPGVPEDARDKLFEPFYTTKPGGTGLGLSLSRSFIEDAGGRLEALPNFDGGMTFRFALPPNGRG